MAKKLSKTQDKVLIYLFEHKDEDAPSADKIADETGLTKEQVTQALTELKEQGMISGPPSLLDETAKILTDMEPNLKATDSGYAEYIILLASILSKADEAFLATQLGYDRDFVNTVGSRLRSGGVWDGDKYSEYRRAAMEKEGDLSFWLDGAIAMGNLMVVGGTKENPQFQMTPVGKASAEKLMRR